MLNSEKKPQIKRYIPLIAFLSWFSSSYTPSWAATLNLSSVNRIQIQTIESNNFEFGNEIIAKGINFSLVAENSGIFPNIGVNNGETSTKRNQQWSLSLLDPFDEFRFNSSRDQWSNENYEVTVLSQTDSSNIIRGIYDFEIDYKEEEEGIIGLFTFSPDQNLLGLSTLSFSTFSQSIVSSANQINPNLTIIDDLSANSLNLPSARLGITPISDDSEVLLSLLPRAFGSFNNNEEESLSLVLNSLTRLGSLTANSDVALLSEENHIPTTINHRFVNPLTQINGSMFELSDQMAEQRLEHQKELMEEQRERQIEMQQRIQEKFEEEKERQQELRAEIAEKRREEQQEFLEKAQERQKKLLEKTIEQQQRWLE